MKEFDPNKADKRLIRQFNEANEEFEARKQELDKEAGLVSEKAEDASLPAHNRDKPAAEHAHISEKIYLFPEEFNALRRELEEHWQTFFHSVNPEMGMSPAYAMAFSAPKFVGMCNGALDMDVQFDSHNVAGICKRFLNGFRKLRGVSPIL